MRFGLALNMALFVINGLFSQNTSTSENRSSVVQPKIMVIPFTKEGEDLRSILEEDVNRRIAITKVKEGFDSRGFTTVDFTAKLKSAKDNAVFNIENQADMRSQIIQLSGADIYVQVEVHVSRGEAGTSVTLVLSGFECSTGNSLSNKVGESGKYYTEDIPKLTSKAVENCIDDFLNVIQVKFNEMLNNGKSVIIDIGFGPESGLKMSTELGDDMLPLSDQIEQWVEKNSFKNDYHIQGTTDLKMIFDDVKIPLRDPVNNNTYNPNKFALELFKFFKSLKIEPRKDIKNNTIYITLN